jgi:hypothetical protein
LEKTMDTIRRGGIGVELIAAVGLATALAAAAVIPSSPRGVTSQKALQHVQAAQQAIQPGCLSVTFPALSGNGCEIYSGQHTLCPGNVPNGAPANHWVASGFGSAYPNACIVYYWRQGEATASLDVWNTGETRAGLAASYVGPHGGSLQLQFGRFGSGWPASISVQ